MKRFVFGCALASVLVLVGCDQAGSDEAALQTEAAVAAAVAEVSADYEARIAALMSDADAPEPTSEELSEPDEGALTVDQAFTKDDLDTLNKKFSYIIGYNMQQQFNADDITLDIETMSAGIRASVQGNSLLSEDETQQVYAEIQKISQEKRQKEFRILSEANEAEGEAFLLANAGKEGVMETESGLQYKVLEEGDGPKPSADDKVTVHYRGTLIDGTVFDSSYDRGEPASFPLSGVIKGWTEGLQLMPVGAKYEFAIPSDLAYGPGGSGRTIGPNVTLLFTVELISID